MDHQYSKAVYNHYIENWKNIPSVHTWDQGPIKTVSPDFKVLKFAPTSSRDMWTYATWGMSSSSDENPLELHIFASQEQDSLVELLTVIAYFHKTGSNLGLEHTVNFGRPWWPDSHCDYGLLSLPYLDGPSLEWLEDGELEVRFLWLIPITRQEVEYKKKHGVEALETLMEKASFNYLDPTRNSVA